MINLRQVKRVLLCSHVPFTSNYPRRDLTRLLKAGAVRNGRLNFTPAGVTLLRTSDPIPKSHSFDVTRSLDQPIHPPTHSPFLHSLLPSFLPPFFHSFLPPSFFTLSFSFIHIHILILFFFLSLEVWPQITFPFL